MDKVLKGVTNYRVYSNEANAQAEMPVSKVVECLIDSASRHAEMRDFGYHHLLKNNHAWVLARLALQMSRYPGVDEVLTVETWVEGFNKHFSSRNFKFLDEKGEVLGFARSVWSVINFTTRESVDLTLYGGIADYIHDVPCPIDRPGRIANVEDELPESYRVRLSDLDVNRHLTTSRYIDHMFDRFTLERFDKQRVDRFEIQFMNEVLYDETIQLKLQEINNEECILEIRNPQDVVCCKCKCNFVEKK